MVIMSFIDGDYLDEIFFGKLTIKERRKVLQLVRDAICEMHKLGFVHGDLRGPNIMYNAKFSKVWFVDFDFAGPIGKAVYPPFLNKGINWADGVKAGAMITPEHDFFWLERQEKM
jgi:RIO-like serine/threonine protein kinase